MSHHVLKSSRRPEAEAYQTYWTSLGVVEIPYIGIAPCVVPSWDEPPTNKSVGSRYMLMRTIASNGQRYLSFCRATCRLSELNALLAFTSRTHSLFEFKNAFLVAWTAASAPAICPAHSCRGPAASWMSPPVTIKQQSIRPSYSRNMPIILSLGFFANSKLQDQGSELLPCFFATMVVSIYIIILGYNFGNVCVFLVAFTCFICILQLGLDQMPDASSSSITSFIAWFVFGISAGRWIGEFL